MATMRTETPDKLESRTPDDVFSDLGISDEVRASFSNMIAKALAEMLDVIEKGRDLSAKSRLVAMSPELKEKRRAMRESAVEPWQYLVRRQHPWRQQLYVKGRNMTAGQLIRSMKTNEFDETQAAADCRLPRGGCPAQAAGLCRGEPGTAGDRGGDRAADAQAGRIRPWPSTCTLTTARIPISWPTCFRRLGIRSFALSMRGSGWTGRMTTSPLL